VGASTPDDVAYLFPAPTERHEGLGRLAKLYGIAVKWV
jgi:hypothetical protein